MGMVSTVVRTIVDQVAKRVRTGLVEMLMQTGSLASKRCTREISELRNFHEQLRPS